MYSELLWEHYEVPRHRGRPGEFHRSVCKSNPICGDSLEFFLALDRSGRVESLSFTAQGCPPVIAVASLVCEWATTRSLQELRGLDEAQLRDWLGPLPPNKRHAFQLCLWALQELVQGSD